MAPWIFWFRCGIGLALGGAVFPAMAQPLLPSAAAGPVAVDRSIVLKIGAHEVSAYGVEKNLLRFRAGRPAEALAGAALEEWFRLFLAQQVILAQAVADGYLERPEVTAMVERMEAHMLTQTEGPFYAALAPPELGDAELAQLYARTGRVRHVVLARFRTEEEAEGSLGDDFRTCPEADRLVRLRQAGAQPGVMWHEGPLAWPYGPFSEVGEALEKLAPGEWFFGAADEDGYAVAQVRRIETRALPEFAGARGQFARFVQMTRKMRVQRGHRSRVLREAEFATDDAVIERLAKRIREVSPASEMAEIPAAVLGSPAERMDGEDRPASAMAQETMFTYTRAGGRESVSVAAFAAYFNQRFVRPRTLDDETLRQAAADMAVAQLDLIEARARGLDREPQFEEDRKNFRNHQALDWFEKERLRPGLAIDDAAIAARYAAQQVRYTRPVKVRARRWVFADFAEASRFLSQRRGGAEDPKVRPLAESEMEIAHGVSVAGLEFVAEPLLRAAPGATFGPLKFGEQAVVWMREATLQEETAPLASVAATLRQELERLALDAKEIALAAELAAAFAVEDRIEYARYGIDPAKVAPWAK